MPAFCASGWPQSLQLQRLDMHGIRYTHVRYMNVRKTLKQKLLECWRYLPDCVSFCSQCFREMGKVYSARCCRSRSFINFFFVFASRAAYDSMSLRGVTQRRHFHRIISIGSSMIRVRTLFLRNCAIAVMLRTCVVGQNAAYFREFVCVCGIVIRWRW